MYGKKGKENISLMVIKLLLEYSISEDQIMYFILNNHVSNNAAVKYILKELCP